VEKLANGLLGFFRPSRPGTVIVGIFFFGNRVALDCPKRNFTEILPAIAPFSSFAFLLLI